MPASSEWGESIVALLEGECDGHLRSVVGYTRETHTVYYLREDVAEEWDEGRFESALDELRLETIESQHINDLFRERHGELNCRVDVFDEAIEMNIAISSGAGLEVAVDRIYFESQDQVVSDVLDAIGAHFHD